MFIQTQETPNPATLKFLPGQVVMAQGVWECKSAEEASASPLATRLMGVAGIKALFFGSDFISVSKTDDEDWEMLKPRIMMQIMDHYMAGLPLFHEDRDPAVETAPDEEDDEITGQIRELIDTRVRPMVAQDGGDIVFNRFEQGIVYLQMRGACAGCPSSTATLKMGIENMLRHYIPEVLEVRPVEAA